MKCNRHNNGRAREKNEENLKRSCCLEALLLSVAVVVVVVGEVTESWSGGPWHAS